MNIYQRIAAVQKECSHVTKDTVVGSGYNKYKAISHDGVLVLLRQSIIENGIIISVSQQAKGVSVTGETKSGTAKIRFEAVYDINFINCDEPDDRMTVAVEAHGEDSNDKAPGKAISYATKTAMLKTFMIVTGENDEERMEESRPTQQSTPTSQPAKHVATSGLISEAQGKRLFAICKSSGTTIAQCANKFGFAKLGEIKKAEYKDICEFAESGQKEELVQEVFNGDTDDDDLPF